MPGGGGRQVGQGFGLPALDRYVIRMLAAPLAGIVAALVLVMLLERAQRILQEMANFGMQPGFFLPLLAWQMPYYLAQALPAGFAAALVVVISRMAADHEWEAMAAAGIAPRRMVRPLTVLALVVAGATLLVAGWLEPLGRHGYRTLHTVALSESRIRTMQPRAVYAPTPEIMITADGLGPDGLSGVFLRAAESDGSESVITAPALRAATNARSATLEFEAAGGTLLTSRNREVRFDSLTLVQPVIMADPARPRGRDARELTLPELLAQDPASLAEADRNLRDAEIYGRLARSLGSLILPWLILPLLLASGAQKRWPAVSLVIILTIALYHGANFCRNLAASGQIGIGAATAVSVAIPLVVCGFVWGLSGGQRAHSPFQKLAGRLRFGFRLPALPAWPAGMSLGHYLSRSVAIMTLAVLVTFTALLQIIDLLEHGEPLIRQNLGWQGFAYYAWSMLPSRLLQAAPVAMLGGALLALVRLRSTNEIHAMQSFGVSATGLIRRILPVPLLLGLAMVCVAEFWLPRSDKAFLPWWDQVASTQAEGGTQERRWFRLPGELVQAGLANADGSELHQPRIYRRNAEGQLEQRIAAERAVWNGSGWTLEQVSIWRSGPSSAEQAVDSMPWAAGLTPQNLQEFFVSFVPLSGRVALRALNEALPGDKAAAFYQTFALMLVSTFLAPLVMFLLVASLIIGPGREKRLSILLFQSLVAGLLFLVVSGYTLVMGQTGQLHPWAAVLIAPLVFAGMGVALALRSDSRA